MKLSNPIRLRGRSRLVVRQILVAFAAVLVSLIIDMVLIEPPGINTQTSPVQASAQLPNLIAGARAHWGSVCF